MKYCCNSFKCLIENAGQKGMWVVHTVYLGERQFMLQSRPFDEDVYEYHSKINPATGKMLGQTSETERVISVALPFLRINLYDFARYVVSYLSPLST